MYIAASGEEMVPASRITRDLKMPRPFLRKILLALADKGILESVRGNGGGFRLLRSPDKIMLSDLMAIFQGDISISDCMFRKKLCANRAVCPLRDQLKEIEAFVIKKIRSVSIASLIRATKKGGNYGNVLQTM